MILALIPGGSAAAESDFSPAAQTTTCSPGGAIRAVALANTLAAGDDNSSAATNIGFTLNFFGTNYTQLYINNNGNVTFGSPLSSFTSAGMSGVSYVTLAPFFADVDTRPALGGDVDYGQVADINGHPAFAVLWDAVGYFSQQTNLLNTFQLVIINRDDRNAGDFDFEFNYSQVLWETGSASGGSGGLGGTSATVGYADGSAGSNDYEVTGSRIPGSFLDSNASTGLIHTELNSGICGRYAFEVVLGTPPDPNAPSVVSILRADPSPSGAASVDFTVSFDEVVTNVDAADFTLTTTGVTGASITSVSAGPADTFTVTVDTGSGSGTIRLDVDAGATIEDMSANALVGPYTGGETYTIDKGAPGVTSVLRQDPLTSPTNAGTLTFRVTFDEIVTNVGTADFSLALTGTVAGSINAVNPQSGTVYDVVITGVTGDGTVGLDFQAANDIQDPAGNGIGASPSIGTEESYTIDNTAIAVIAGGVAGLPGPVTMTDGGSYTTHFTSMTVTFNSDASNPAGSGDPDDVTNPDNYVLIEAGVDGVPGLAACGLADGDDVPVAVGAVTYDNGGGAGPFTASFPVNGGTALPSGDYRLLVCGTTSITDLTGNPLNGGSDTIVDFTIFDPSTPATGFAPGRVTSLPAQPAGRAYRGVGMQLEIPRLSLRTGIVGVPLVDEQWDVTWLGRQAGWLEGTAYPTWAGNTVLTAHVWDALNRPGPFAGIGQLQYGDEVIVESGGAQYVYAVRTVWSVRASDTSRIFRHEQLDWLTLLTCQGYDPSTGEYAQRLVVRAVLVDVR